MVVKIILGVYLSVNFMALFGILILWGEENGNFSFVNPIVIYNKINVNWFGAWFLAIVCNIGLPLVAIPYWIYKICTVGRK